MSEINKEVGLNIRKIREDKGLSQEKLAALADLLYNISPLWVVVFWVAASWASFRRRNAQC